MKKIFLSTVLLGALVCTASLGQEALADDSNGKVSYKAGELVIDPEGGGEIGEGLPKDLNFGEHEIQNKVNETWVATVDGGQNSELTTGTLNVEDNRGSAEGWNVKVTQNKQFTSGSDELTGSALTIFTGAINNNGGNAPSIGADKELGLTVGTSEVIFQASETEGEGYSTLNLDKFELAVPATAEKKQTTYTTDITWTLASTPA